MEKQHIYYLLEQQKNRKLTESEQAELRELLAGEESENLVQAVIDQFMAEANQAGTIDNTVQEASFQRVIGVDKRMSGIPDSTNSRIVSIHFLRKWGWAAASILLLLAGAAYWWNSDRNSSTTNYTAKTEEIVPGSEGAILTLADGSTMILDSVGKGLVANQNGTKLFLEDGQLTYKPVEKGSVETGYNTMTTPIGRQFQVVLADGTKVWLNAASSLTYPANFSGNERRVSITGEVYFEVAPQAKQPFFVKINEEVEIQVLGTRFNANAYENEASINTTLLEGSVKVLTPNLPASDIILHPGQQATIFRDAAKSPVRINSQVDTDQVMAWKNGKFSFNRADIKTVMRELARWYNIEIEYRGNITKDLFGGDIQRNLPLDRVLDFLKQSQVHFEVSGNKVIVMP